MTDAESAILAKAKRGIQITAQDVVATITSHAELDAYSDGLKRRGALTADAMKAVAERAGRLSKIGQL